MESLGLAAPRRKTKYDIDPRNNAWANDDNKFGQKLMEKFGWEKGKGLGAQEDGETENIKVKVKNDKHGIGANNDYSDTWLDHQDDFNSILASLNTCHSAPGSGTATPTNEPSTEAVAGSMEERSKSSKSRVHYKKFTQGKDLTRADASDLDALFGRRKKFEKRSRKIKKAAKSEPVSPLGATTPAGLTPLGGNSPRKDDAATESDIKEEQYDKEYDAAGNLRTVTNSMSVSDYFAKKMAEIKARRNAEAGGATAAPTAIDTFCENSIRRSQEGEDTKPEVKEEVIKTEDPSEEDKPEVYRQEKFQAATMSVQQYFEQKMKEKKARAEAAAAVAIKVEGGDDNLEMQKFAEESTEEPKKKKKKKNAKNSESVLPKPEDDQNNNASTEEKSIEPKEKKKKKKARVMGEETAEKEVGVALTDVGEKPKKKKKKNKENPITEPVPDGSKLDATQPVVEIVGGCGQEKEGLEKRKKRKRKRDDCATKIEQSQETSGVPENKEIKKKKKKKINKTLIPVSDIAPSMTEAKSTDETPAKKKKKKKKCPDNTNDC